MMENFVTKKTNFEFLYISKLNDLIFDLRIVRDDLRMITEEKKCKIN